MAKWQNRDALIEYMAPKFKKPAVAIVGVGIGDLAESVLQGAKPATLLLVDTWKGAAWQAVAVAERFKASVKKRVVAIQKKSSLQGSRCKTPANGFDWIWLTSPTANELKAWSKKIGDGAWILGSNYGDVSEALQGFCATNPEFKLAGTTDDGCWGIVRISA